MNSMNNDHKKFQDKVYFNKFVQNLYKAHFYFKLGKGQIAKVIDPFTEFASFVILLTFVGGVDLTRHKPTVALLFLFAIFLITIGGKLYHISGLWDVEVDVDAAKHPVTNAQYQAAKIILKKYDKEGNRIKK